jgi:hypothetical protein
MRLGPADGAQKDRSALPAVILRSPRAGNSREQARTAVGKPQHVRGFSRVFPAVLGVQTYRGVRFDLALLSHFRALCGLLAV